MKNGKDTRWVKSACGDFSANFARVNFGGRGSGCGLGACFERRSLIKVPRFLSEIVSGPALVAFCEQKESDPSTNLTK
jgi:hypothetical protein